MGLPQFYVNTNELATLSNTFMVNGVPTDPTGISVIVTDPTGTITTYTYSPGSITRTGTGAYQQLVACTVEGLWSYVWIGTGVASDANPGTWRVFGASLGLQYASAEELKDRLMITDTFTDFQIARAIRAASRMVERHCGRHFYQIVEPRTFVPYNIYMQPIDDLVSITSLNVDQNGTGVYDQVWPAAAYQLTYAADTFNANAWGEPVPYNTIRVAQTGMFFPFIWPFARIDRVQVIGTWGWPQVPFDVSEATLIIAADMFKSKDAPFGVAGIGEFGMIRISKVNPAANELLMPYRSPKRKVGM